VLAIAVNDVAMSVDPWIPCSGATAAALSPAVIQAQQAKVADLALQVYAPSEASHGSLVSRLQQLISSRGASTATAGQDTICTLSGGIDQVHVVSFNMTSATDATITFQAHVWNETIGISHGNPFHFKPECVIEKTDQATKENGTWLITDRGDMSYISGGP